MSHLFTVNMIIVVGVIVSDGAAGMGEVLFMCVFVHAFVGMERSK